MKKLFILLMLCSGMLLLTNVAQAQVSMKGPKVGQVTEKSISGYYTESFESTTFPPTGWQRISLTGANVWDRSTAVAHTGVACAYMSYQATGGLDWLILPRYRVGNGDSLTFWMRLQFLGFAPDSLSIKVSTGDSSVSSFATTILALKEGVNYPGNITTWVKYGVSLSAFAGQQVYIGFKHYNMNGDGIYIDDVTVGRLLTMDASCTNVVFDDIIENTYYFPSATIANLSSSTQSVTMTMAVLPSAYTSIETQLNMAPGTTSVKTCNMWNAPPVGDYTVKVYTQLAGDVDQTNDTLTRNIKVLPSFPNIAWTSYTAAPEARWGTAPVNVTACNAGLDSSLIFLMGGSNATFNTTATNIRYNITAGTWNTKAPLPIASTYVIPMAINNKIYVIGGSTNGSTPIGNTQIYDVATNTWSVGAALPIPVADYAADTYGDSLIYIIGGFNGATGCNNVQIYHPSSNTWTVGTAKPGVGVTGGRMGISDNKIVFAGGYNMMTSEALANVYVGTINPSDPENISWTATSDYPLGTVTNLAAGTSYADDHRVYFCGGDPTGEGEAVIDEILAYNLATSAWETGPNMPHSLSYLSGLASAVRNNRYYLVSMGGYDGANIVAHNDWIRLFNVPTPYVTPDTMVCPGGSIMLEAGNGISYLWSPATGLSSTNTATTLASPAVTTTWSVIIDQNGLCPATETVTVEINTLGAIMENDTTPSPCMGYLTAIAIAGVPPYTYLWNDPSAQTEETAMSLCAGTYTCVITDGLGCTASTTATVFATIGIQEHELQLGVYPNPTHELLQVEAVFSGKAVQIALTNASGSIDLLLDAGVLSGSYNRSFDLSQLPAGIYTLRIREDEITVAVMKIVKL